MSTTATPLLPPAQETGTAAFDMRAFAADLKSTPKQDYSAAWTEPQPERPSAEQPGATAPPGDAGHGQPKGEEAPKNEGPQAETGSAKETARVFLMMYDNLVSQVCTAIADHPDYTPKRFAMDEAQKREAEKQLAIGIEKNNWAGLPWWGILAMMLVASGVANWLLVREARKDKRRAKEAANAAQNRERQQRGQTLHPDSITDKSGRPVTQPAPAQPGPTPPAASLRAASPDPASPKGDHFKLVTDANGQTIGYENTRMPLCQQCGEHHVKSPRHKYCSQSCAGKATSKNRSTIARA